MKNEEIKLKHAPEIKCTSEVPNKNLSLKNHLL